MLYAFNRIIQDHPLNGYFIGNIPYFQTNPYAFHRISRMKWLGLSPKKATPRRTRPWIPPAGSWTNWCGSATAPGAVNQDVRIPMGIWWEFSRFSLIFHEMFLSWVAFFDLVSIDLFLVHGIQWTMASHGFQFALVWLPEAIESSLLIHGKNKDPPCESSQFRNEQFLGGNGGRSIKKK